MIEPQSMHDGASAWVAKATFVPPRFSVIPPPLVGLAEVADPLLWPFAWPLVCPLECPLDVAPTVARYPSSTFSTRGAGSPYPSAEGAVSRSATTELAFG